MTKAHATSAIRGQFLDIASAHVQTSSITENIRHHEDGLLLIGDGRIQWFGDWKTGQEKIPQNCSIHHHPKTP